MPRADQSTRGRGAAWLTVLPAFDWIDNRCSLVLCVPERRIQKTPAGIKANTEIWGVNGNIKAGRGRFSEGRSSDLLNVSGGHQPLSWTHTTSGVRQKSSFPRHKAFLMCLLLGQAWIYIVVAWISPCLSPILDFLDIFLTALRLVIKSQKKLPLSKQHVSSLGYNIHFYSKCVYSIQWKGKTKTFQIESRSFLYRKAHHNVLLGCFDANNPGLHSRLSTMKFQGRKS